MAIRNFSLDDVQADHVLEVLFKAVAVLFTITASAGPGGTIDPSGSVQVPQGGSQVFTITEDVGMEVDKILLDGVEQPIPPAV